MHQLELEEIVNGLKADISRPAGLDRKTVADRANMANAAALAMLTETVAEKNDAPLAAKAADLRMLARELGDITDYIATLEQRSAKR